VIQAFWRFVIPLITVLLWVQDGGLAEDPVYVLVPAFNGGPLGRNVGTVINLKIWRTLRAQSENLHGKPFKDATVFWSNDPLPDTSYDAAEQRAAHLRGKLVLWGSIVTFGDAVLAQPLLAILPGTDPTSDDPSTWTLSMPGGGSGRSLSVGIPRRRYDLPPLVLSREVLELYNTTSSIKIYKGRNGHPPDGVLGPAIGELGSAYTRLEDDGDFSKVRAQSGQVGWVYLQKLDDETDVVDFVGGIIRLLRRDYLGAIDMLKNVSIASRSVMLRVDSLLLQALATAKMGNDPSAPIDSALKLDPYVQVSIKFKIMSLIWKIKKSSGEPRQTEISELLHQITENGYLFSPEDSWLDTSKRIAFAAKEQ
jgi:hypothetical protein